MSVPDWTGAAKLNHPSTVRLAGRREVESAAVRYWLRPSRLNACPDLPAAKVTPFTGVSGLPSTASAAAPSAFHQLAGGLPEMLTPSATLPLMTFRAAATAPPT